MEALAKGELDDTIEAAPGPDGRELARQELTIARKYIGPFPVVMAIWGLGNLACGCRSGR